MKDELMAGIKNALERGANLQQAMQTFINAGYNPQEVFAAGKMIKEGVEIPDNTGNEKKSEGLSEKNSLPQLPKIPTTEKKHSNVFLIVVMILALIIFLSSVGYLVYKLLQ